MWLTIIFSTILFILLFLIIIEPGNVKSGNEEKIKTSIGFILAIGIVYFLLHAFINSVINKKIEYKEYKDLPIKSFFTDENWNIEGHFFLGIGGFSGGSNTYYVTYGKFSKGIKRLELSTSNHYIKETNKENPKIKKYLCRVITPVYKSKWTFRSKKIKYSEWQRDYLGEKIIIVPENTILKKFKLE